MSYFLAESAFTDLHLGSSGGLDDAQWFPLGSVGDLNFYDDTLKIIVPAINVLARKTSGSEAEVEAQKPVEEREETHESRIERRGGRRSH